MLPPGTLLFPRPCHPYFQGRCPFQGLLAPAFFIFSGTGLRWGYQVRMRRVESRGHPCLRSAPSTPPRGGTSYTENPRADCEQAEVLLPEEPRLLLKGH